MRWQWGIGGSWPCLLGLICQITTERSGRLGLGYMSGGRTASAHRVGRFSSPAATKTGIAAGWYGWEWKGIITSDFVVREGAILVSFMFGRSLLLCFAARGLVWLFWCTF